MAEEIKIPVIMDTSTIPGSINSLNAAIQKLNSNIESGFKKTSSAVKKTTDDSKKGLKALSDEVSKLPLKFLTLEKAIQAVKQGFSFLIDGVKEFEKQTGQTATGGFARINQAMQQFKIEAGKVLEPIFVKIADGFEKNKTEMEQKVRDMTAGIVIFFTTIYSVVTLVGNGIAGALTMIVNLFVKAMLVSATFIEKIPKRFFPGTLHKEIQDLIVDLKDMSKALDIAVFDEFLKGTAKDISFVINSVSGALDTSASGVKATNDELEQQRKNRLAKEKYIYEEMTKLIKARTDAEVEEIKARYDIGVALQNRYIEEQTMMYKFDYEQNQKRFDLNYQAAVEYYANINALMDAESKMGGIGVIRDRSKLQQEESLTIANITSGLKTASKAPSTLVTRRKQTAKTELGFSPDYSNVVEFKKQANEILDYQVEVYNQMAIAGLDYTEQRIKLEKMYADYETEQKRLSVEATFNEVSSKTELYANMAQQIISISTMVSEAQIANVQRQKESDLAALNESYNMRVKNIKHTSQLEKERQAAQDKINKDALEKEREIKNKQKGWSIASAIINGAVAVTRGFAEYGPIVGAIMAVLTAATTSVQVGLIASQKFATGGIVGGTGNKDNVSALLTPGEMVINKQQQTHLWDIIAGRTPTPAPTITMGGDTFYVQGNLDQNAVDQVKQAKEKRLQQLRQDYNELQYRGQLKAA